MKLTENPIFLTQRRLTRRSGVLAPVLIATLTGLILLAGLSVGLVDPKAMHFAGPESAGKFFYGWIVGLEIVVFVLGAVRIARVLGGERKAGLWESNCLSPLRPGEIVLGYWLGGRERELYMAAVLAGVGAGMILMTWLSPLLWLGTQVLVLSTALFFGLLAALFGMAGQKSRSDSLGMVPLGLVLGVPFILSFQGMTVLSYLLPIYPLAVLFRDGADPNPMGYYASGRLYAWAISPLALSLVLQFCLGLCFWRAATRKTADPGQPLLERGEALVIFGLLVITQHALVWGSWVGGAGNRDMPDMPDMPMLPFTQGGAILVGSLLLAVASPQPERLRLALLRVGGGPRRSHQSATVTALGLGLLGALAILPGMLRSVGDNWPRALVASVNLLECLLMFALLLQFCRLRFGLRAPGFFVLGLFVLCLLPLIVAMVLENDYFAQCSFLAPGVVALAGNAPNLEFLGGVIAGHAVIVGLLFVAWRQQWQRLLDETSALAGGA